MLAEIERAVSEKNHGTICVSSWKTVDKTDVTTVHWNVIVETGFNTTCGHSNTFFCETFKTSEVFAIKGRPLKTTDWYLELKKLPSTHKYFPAVHLSHQPVTQGSDEDADRILSKVVSNMKHDTGSQTLDHGRDGIPECRYCSSNGSLKKGNVHVFFYRNESVGRLRTNGVLGTLPVGRPARSTGCVWNYTVPKDLDNLMDPLRKWKIALPKCYGRWEAVSLDACMS